MELADGHTTTYVRFAPTATHSVAAIVINAKAEVLIQREYSYPPNKVMWQLPGGSMLPGESPEAAALREVAEESGYSARSTLVLGSFYTNNRLSDKKQYVVLCRDLFKYQLPKDDDEFIETHWMTKKKLVTMVTNREFDNINLLAALNLWFHSKQL